jgi:uncharacterized protein DUF6299
MSLVLGAALPGALVVAPAAAQPPSNDTFANATVISSVPFFETLDTTQATTDALDAEVLAACGVSIPVGATVWYAYTPPVDQVVAVSTAGSNYSTGVGVVTGAPGSFVAAACSLGSVSFSATAGETYYIAVADTGSLTGGTLNISVTESIPPELDLSVDRFGRFDAHTGTATVTGTATCTSGAFGGISLTLTQQVGRIATISGFGFANLTCDGTEQQWSVTVFPSTGLFKGGHANVVADAFACGPTLCVSEHVERTIVLRH